MVEVISWSINAPSTRSVGSRGIRREQESGEQRHRSDGQRRIRVVIVDAIAVNNRGHGDLLLRIESEQDITIVVGEDGDANFMMTHLIYDLRKY